MATEKARESPQLDCHSILIGHDILDHWGIDFSCLDPDDGLRASRGSRGSATYCTWHRAADPRSRP